MTLPPMDRAATSPAGGEAAEGPSPGGVQSVARSLTILDLLSGMGSASVVQLAAELGVHKSTASRLLSELESHDLVTQHEERGKYELGFGILRLAHSIPARLNLVTEAAPEMRRLAETHRETVNLAVFRQGWAVNVAQEIGPRALGTFNWVGNLTPSHATSSGKVLLAGSSTTEQERHIQEHGLEKFTSHTVTDPDTLLKQLNRAAKLGYATVSQEWEAGLNAVAVPVMDHLGTVVAALSISGPTFRFTKATMNSVVEDLKDAGAAVSRRMGYEPAR